MSDLTLSIYLLDWKAMQQHVADCAPEEACGVLAGKGCRVSRVFPIENELHSPVRFRMMPQLQLDAFLAMDKAGEDLLSYYHSHPEGRGEPSSTDLAEYFYPGAIMLIWYRKQDLWQAKAWSIKGKQFCPVIIQIIEN